VKLFPEESREGVRADRGGARRGGLKWDLRIFTVVKSQPVSLA
jgi:hypothetical protein